MPQSGENIQLEFDGDLVALPENLKQLMNSIIDDSGEIPPVYLVAADPTNMTCPYLKAGSILTMYGTALTMKKVCSSIMNGTTNGSTIIKTGVY